jgi:CRP/FNR family transcriptional regulator, cyclic AMP receptor protein
MVSNHPTRRFDVRAFLNSAGVKKKSLKYRRAEGIFSQGDVCSTVMYIQTGGVKLSVRSETGKEVVVAVLGPGDFFGEGCLAGQPRRMGSATALRLSTIVVLKNQELLRLLHKQPGMADRFITHILGANVRIEGQLVDQLFNDDEKRLARRLLLLARYGSQDTPEPVRPRVSQAKLAKMTGSSHSSVKRFMKRFKQLGFVEAGRELKINRSLLTVVLHE